MVGHKTQGKQEENTEFCWRNLLESDHFQNQKRNEKIILKRILTK
jgi:hypothetical protein